MKIRQGFVSNSSSSSFLAVGIDRYSKYFNKALEAIDFYEDWQKVEDLEPKFNHYDHGQFVSKETDICVINDDANFVGLLAGKRFMRNMKFSQIQTEFRDKMKSLGVVIPRNEIKLRYGKSDGC